MIWFFLKVCFCFCFVFIKRLCGLIERFLGGYDEYSLCLLCFRFLCLVVEIYVRCCGLVFRDGIFGVEVGVFFVVLNCFGCCFLKDLIVLEVMFWYG